MIARRCPDLSILGARDVTQARIVLANAQALVAALVDVVLPDGNGLDLVRLIAEKHPRARIVVISGFPDSGAALRAQQDGARFLPKPVAAAALVAALREQRGSTKTAQALLDEYARTHKLSRRQREVIEGWMNEQSFKQIAATMGVSVNTVGTHARRIFDRAGCRGKASVIKAVFTQSHAADASGEP